MALTTAFGLPESGESYISLLRERCYDLIDSQVWDGLKKARLDTWLHNFRTPEEKYFAAVVLDALIYRSSDQTRSLLVELFQRSIPDLIRSINLPNIPTDEWTTALRKHWPDPGIRLIPVIRRVDPPTKSGPLVCRLLRRHLQIQEHWMIWPWDIEVAIKKGIRTFLFVDDFLGTGNQFRKFAERLDLNCHANSNTFFYAPLVAHAKGLLKLQKKLDYLHVTAVELLGDNHSIFSNSSGFFQDGVNSP